MMYLVSPVLNHSGRDALSNMAKCTITLWALRCGIVLSLGLAEGTDAVRDNPLEVDVGAVLGVAEQIGGLPRLRIKGNNTASVGLDIQAVGLGSLLWLPFETCISCSVSLRAFSQYRGCSRSESRS
jgi:hypothetical protein